MQANFTYRSIKFSTMFTLNIFFILKKISMKYFLASTLRTLKTVQTIRCPYKPIILSIVHFESPTEVQLNSW